MDWNALALKHFSATQQCTRAGFILTDGTMLDFGDPNDPTKLKRVVDHSAISLIDQINYPSVTKFQNEARGLRTHFSFQYFNIQTFAPPTQEQWKTIERCMCDFKENLKEVNYERRKAFSGGAYSYSVSTELTGNCKDGFTDLQENAKVADQIIEEDETNG